MPLMVPQYIDTHAHLFSNDYCNDLDAVLERAQQAGVRVIIVPGTDLKSSYESVQLAEQHENIYACVGVHPHEAEKSTDKDLKQIEEISKHPKVVAIGEIGLDYHYDYSPKERQRIIFAAQMEIAVRRKLPVVVHTRESTEDAFTIVQQTVNASPQWNSSKTTPKRGVFHCFPGTIEQVMLLRELGFYVSYPGIVTFAKSKSIEIVKEIGVQGILLETDSPYMTPVPLRGKRNEPANIVYIGRAIAKAVDSSEEEVAHTTTENAIRLFGLSNSTYSA